MTTGPEKAENAEAARKAMRSRADVRLRYRIFRCRAFSTERALPAKSTSNGQR
jgi:hypothetical protein